MEQQDLLPDLIIDSTGTQQLKSFASWAKFLSIIGFIFCGLIAIIAIFAGSILSGSMNRYDTYGSSYGSGMGAIVTIIYLIMTGVYFIPTLFLFQSASRLKTAIDTTDQLLFNEGLTKLKASFRFWGILTIIIISIYVIILIIAALAATMAR